MRRLIMVLALGASMCSSGRTDPDSAHYINIEKDDKGQRAAVPFWSSADALRRCMKQGFDRLDDGQTDRNAFTGGACNAGRIGDLPHGTAVEILAPSSECGIFTTIRALEGEHKGQVGCVPLEALSPQRLP